jgi:hypothetical protein
MLANQLNRLFASGVLVLAASSARADVITVDATEPSADFDQIQAAIDFASEGDLILVGANNGPSGPAFGSFEIVGKSLTLLFAGNVTVDERGSTIRDLAPGQSVVLRGCRFNFDDVATDCVLSENALSVVNNQGSVWVEACTFDYDGQVLLDCTALTGGDNLLQTLVPEARIIDSETVYLRSVLFRRLGSTTQTQPPVLEIQGSEVVVYDTAVEAGTCLLPGGSGAVAAEVTDSQVGFWDSILRGGIGGPSTPSGSIPGGSGGTGLSIVGSSASTVFELGVDGAPNLIGGVGGGGAVPGMAAEPFINQAGPEALQFLEPYVGRLQSQLDSQIQGGSWFDPGGFLWLRIFDAPPDVPAFLFVSSNPNPSPLQLMSGVSQPISVDPVDNFFLVLDPTDSEGFSQFRVTDDLLEPLSFYVQGVTVDPLEFGVQLTNPTFLTVF